MKNNIRCLDCIHCKENIKKCYPESMDCKSEYDLDDKDIYEYRLKDCDFFKRRHK